MKVLARGPSIVVTVGLALAACGSRLDYQCEQDQNCDLGGGGRCIANDSTGHPWCAYPDPRCPSGYRFSDQDVGDGVGGTCVEDTDVTLTVSIAGSGAGDISSTPAGLVCSSDSCTGSFPKGTAVKLAANATTGAFLGWTDGCHGANSCAVTMDQDRAVGVIFGAPGEALWATQIGGAEDEIGIGNAVDGDGNIVVAGVFGSQIQAGTTTLTSAGRGDVFVVKLAGRTGEVLWARRFGGSDHDEPLSMAVDDAGNVYVAGYFMGPVDFGGGLLNAHGYSDGFLLKLASNGDFTWVRAFQGPGTDMPMSVSTHGTTVGVGGAFDGSLTLDGATVTSAGGADAFIAKLSTDNSVAWIKSYGGPYDDLSYTGTRAAIAVDHHDNLVVAGGFVGTTDFGGGPLTSADYPDVFLVKYAAATGAYLFSRRFGGIYDDRAVSITIDDSDNLIMTGYFHDVVDFGSGSPFTAGPGASMFLAKYTLAGAHVWSKSFGGIPNSGAFAQSVTVNATGDVAIAGEFGGRLSLGGALLSSAGGWPTDDAFAARFQGGNGDHISSVRAGGNGDEGSTGIAEDSSGRFYVTGWFEGFADFGGRALTSAGHADVFVAGFAPL